MRTTSRLWFCLVLQLLPLMVGVAPITPASTSRVTLVWDDWVNTDQDGYVVWRRPNRSNSVYIALVSVDATTRTYTDTTVVVNQRVCYVVEAFRDPQEVSDPGEVSAPSNEVCTRVRAQ
jgi:hypothetical protein